MSYTVVLIGHPERFTDTTERKAVSLCRECWRQYGHGEARILIKNNITGEYHGAWMRY